MGTFTTSEEILGHIYCYCNRMKVNHAHWTYLLPCAFQLCSLQLLGLIHHQGALYSLPDSAKFAYQTSTHCRFSSATSSPPKSESPPRVWVSVPEQYQYSSTLWQLEWAHVALRCKFWNLKAEHIIQSIFLYNKVYALLHEKSAIEFIMLWLRVTYQ